MTIEHIEFQTAAQLIAAIEKLAGTALRLDEVYVKDRAGEDLTEVALEQETLSDGSVAFNLVLSSESIAPWIEAYIDELSRALDPNS